MHTGMELHSVLCVELAFMQNPMCRSEKFWACAWFRTSSWMLLGTATEEAHRCEMIVRG